MSSCQEECKVKMEDLVNPGVDEIPEITEKKLKEDREKQVRSEIKDALKKVSVALSINDDGISGAIDAACEIDRHRIVIEEMKSLVGRLETSYDELMKETSESICSGPAQDELSWLKSAGGRPQDPPTRLKDPRINEPPEGFVRGDYPSFWDI